MKVNKFCLRLQLTLLKKIKIINNLYFFLFIFLIWCSHLYTWNEKQQKIEKPFLAAVSTTLGDRYTENVEGIYKITIKFVIETLVEGYEKQNKINQNHVGNSKGVNSTSNSNVNGANSTTTTTHNGDTSCNSTKAADVSWAS